MDLHRDEEQRTVAPTAAQRCELIDHHSADVRRGGVDFGVLFSLFRWWVVSFPRGGGGGGGWGTSAWSL